MIEPYYSQDGITIYHGDCREIAPQLSGVTAIVSDPPYGLSFMGKDWDHGIPGQHFWELIGEACLPGAMCLAFGGTRTYHRLVCAIEDAGFEIRDCIQWIYGSGFPKSLDISKAIDKAAGAEREVVGTSRQLIKDSYREMQGRTDRLPDTFDITTPATEHAKTWNGYGTALKPAHEPICVAMKPLSGTYAQNAIEHGVAGINVDGCRVEHDEECKPMKSQDGGNKVYGQSGRYEETTELKPNGRWPANIIHDGSDEVIRLFPDNVKGVVGAKAMGKVQFMDDHEQKGTIGSGNGLTDSGSAARFFYCAKASDREIQPSEDFPLWGESYEAVKNTHPTVKPIALMTYLVKLVTMPERNLILDPFAGSGSTLVACQMSGIPAIGIELHEEHCEIAANRLRQG